MPSHISDEQLEKIFGLLKDMGGSINVPLNSLMGLLGHLEIGPYGLFAIYCRYMRKEEEEANSKLKEKLKIKYQKLELSESGGHEDGDKTREMRDFEDANIINIPRSVFPSLLSGWKNGEPVFVPDRWFAELLSRSYSMENDLDYEEKRRLRELGERYKIADDQAKIKIESELVDYIREIFRTPDFCLRSDTIKKYLDHLVRDDFVEFVKLIDRASLKRELTAQEKKRCYDLLCKGKFEELSGYIKIDTLSFIFLTYSLSKGEGNGRTLRATIAHKVIEEFINNKSVVFSSVEQETIELIRLVCEVYAAIVSLRKGALIISDASSKAGVSSKTVAADGFQSPRSSGELTSRGTEGRNKLAVAAGLTSSPVTPPSSPSKLSFSFSSLSGMFPSSPNRGLSLKLASDERVGLEENVAKIFRLLYGVSYHLSIARKATKIWSESEVVIFKNNVGGRVGVCISDIDCAVKALDAWLRKLCSLISLEALEASNVSSCLLDRILRTEVCYQQGMEKYFREELEELYFQLHDSNDVMPFILDQIEGLIFNPEIKEEFRWKFFQQFCANVLVFLKQFAREKIEEVLKSTVAWVQEKVADVEKVKKIATLYGTVKAVMNNSSDAKLVNEMATCLEGVPVSMPLMPPSSPSLKKSGVLYSSS